MCINNIYLFQVNLILSLEELLEFLCIRHHFITKKYQQYPNNHWYDPFSNSLPDRYSNRPVNAQRTSGEKISEAIKPPPVCTVVLSYIMLHAMLGYGSLLKPIFSLSVSHYISLISGLEVLLEHVFHFCK